MLGQIFTQCDTPVRHAYRVGLAGRVALADRIVGTPVPEVDQRLGVGGLNRRLGNHPGVAARRDRKARRVLDYGASLRERDCLDTEGSAAATREQHEDQQ